MNDQYPWPKLTEEEWRMVAKIRKDLFEDDTSSRTVATRLGGVLTADEIDNAYNGLDAEDDLWWTGAEHRNTDDQGEILEAYGILPSERLAAMPSAPPPHRGRDTLVA